MAKKKTKDIPPSKLKWLKRPKERRELPAHYFLLPKERKFPYKNKDGSINCRLLRAAITRAAQHGYPSVEKRARKLYEKHCKEKAITLLNEDYRILDWWELANPDNETLVYSGGDELVKAKVKVDETPNELRIRVKDPDRFDPKSFRYITLSEEKGVKAVVGCPKGKFKGGKCEVGTEIQSYRFDKEKWTKEEAKKWVKEHKKKGLHLVDLTKATAILRINAPVNGESAKRILDGYIVWVATRFLSDLFKDSLCPEMQMVMSLPPERRVDGFLEAIISSVSEEALHSPALQSALKRVELTKEYVNGVLMSTKIVSELLAKIKSYQPTQPSVEGPLQRLESGYGLPLRLSTNLDNFIRKADNGGCRTHKEICKFVESLIRGYVISYPDDAMRKISAFNLGMALEVGMRYQLSKSQVERLVELLTVEPMPVLTEDEVISKGKRIFLTKLLLQ